VGLVAGRVLSLARDADGTQRLVFQPGVVISPCALVAQELAPRATRAPDEQPNPYIARLTLTQ